MDIIAECELANPICVMRAVAIKYEKDRFSGCVSSGGLRYERVFKPLCANKVIGPTIRRCLGTVVLH